METFMRMIALAGLALALSACGGGGETAANDSGNVLPADNMMMDPNMMMDSNMSMNGATTLDSNMAAGANTQEMMANDAASNDADTNLANGL
jgi:hypothetical protein